MLGKIVSMLVSHGSVLCILSRAAQQILGSHVAQHGWSVSVELTSQCRTEFSQLLTCLCDFNGQHIHNAHYGIRFGLHQSFEEYSFSCQYAVCVICDSVSQAFHFLADGSFCYTQDFVSSGSQHHLGDVNC